jgi:hypothetical protein
MADADSIKIVKTVPFKGGTREWSNRYHFDGTSPANSTQWTTLADAVVTAEKHCYNSWIHLVRAVGYIGGSEVPVFSKDYSAITGDAGYSDTPNAAEVAALVRYSTTKRSSKNHPVYLFNYYHGAYTISATENDFLSTDQKADLEAYADLWLAGFSDGAHTHHRTGPDQTLATARFVEPYVTHRDFRR